MLDWAASNEHPSLLTYLQSNGDAVSRHFPDLKI